METYQDDNTSLLKIGGGKLTKDHDGPGVRQKPTVLFLYPDAFKTCANLWEGENLDVLDHQ
jgi:hypothetical protein